MRKIRTNYGFIPKGEIVIDRFPKSPKITMGNYTHKLMDKKIDTPNSFIQAIYNKEMIKLVDSKRLNKWPKYFKAIGSFHKVTLPRHIDPKLAYFMGYFYADGSLKDIIKSKLKRNKYEHQMKVGDEFLMQVEILNKLLNEIFNLDTKIRTERIEKGENYYYVEINDKVLYRFITKLFSLPCGPKTGKLKMPSIILNCPKELRKWFIRGVFDGDGETRAFEYYKNKNLIKPRIRLHMKDHLFISEIKKLLLSDFDLKFNGPYIDKGNKATCIQIERKDEIKKANKEKLFMHPLKKWRLEKFCSNLKNQK